MTPPPLPVREGNGVAVTVGAGVLVGGQDVSVGRGELVGGSGVLVAGAGLSVGMRVRVDKSAVSLAGTEGLATPHPATRASISSAAAAECLCFDMPKTSMLSYGRQSGNHSSAVPAVSRCCPVPPALIT